MYEKNFFGSLTFHYFHKFHICVFVSRHVIPSNVCKAYLEILLLGSPWTLQNKIGRFNYRFRTKTFQFIIYIVHERSGRW